MNTESSEDATAKTLLRQHLYYFPSQFGNRHDKIANMRYQLRCWLLKELTGEYSHFLFGNEEIENRVFLPPTDWLPLSAEKSRSHHGRPCARKLERGEPTHRCLTCGLDDTCVLCKYCFNPADHEGHNVFVKISSRDDGGICDCGDHEAWKREVHCLADRGPQEFTQIPEEFKRRASNMLDVMFDYAVDVLSGASLATQTAKTETVLWKLSEASELDSEKYGVPPRLTAMADGKKWCLLVWDGDKRSITDLHSSLQLATERGSHFIKIITKRIQTAGRATVAISSSLPEMVAMRNKIKHFKTSIRSVEDVMREEMVFEIISVALDLCHCHISQAEPTALVKLVGQSLLRDWQKGSKRRDPMLADLLVRQRPDSNAVVYAMSDLQDVGQGIPDATYERYLRNELGEEEDVNNSLETDEELFGPRNIFGKRAQDLSEFLQNKADASVDNWPIESSDARVKFLIFFDVRLYKVLRLKLTDLYVAALVSNPELKMHMAAVYADVYPMLVDQYTHIDDDPDLSVTIALSTQLFTTPSIATALMETDAFMVYMKMLYNLFSRKGRLNPKVIRNRRLGQVFHEFGYLLWRNTKKEVVGFNPKRIAHTASFLALFQGLAPMQRQIDQHVEYENERWIYCYASMPYALQLARSVAIGIDHGVKNSLPDSLSGIQIVAQGLYHWQNAINDDILYESHVHSYTYGNLGEFHIKLASINTAKDPLSLLHPVHYFLSWLIEFSTINDVEALRTALLVDRENTSDLTLFDASMCTLATLSQISVGYWVRNGYAMKVQLQCYRDATLRDLAYSRDIFLIQVAMCILNPNAVFVNLMHCFSVSEWPGTTLGDTQQAFYILDEFLHCLTLLLCDRLKFQGLTGVELKRAALAKEIIQALGFETMPYSALTKLVPESLIVDEQFDMVLSECADFSPPKGTHGVGMYTLKPSMYEQFDPQYTHYTIARTEEAEKAAECKLGKLHLPPLLPLKGAWANLGDFTLTLSFAWFVNRTIEKLQEAEASQAEQSMGRIIHLLLMAAKHDLTRDAAGNADNKGTRETNERFDSVADLVMATSTSSENDAMTEDVHNAEIQQSGVSIYAQLLALLQNHKFASIHPRIEQLLTLLHENNSAIPLPSSNTDETNEKASEEHNKRRQIGKAMQQKVLENFMRQQQQFMESNMMDDHDDEDSDEDKVEGLDEDTTNGYTFPKYCVLCRMPDDEDSIYGILTYTSKLKMMRDLPMSDPYWVKQAFSEDASLDIDHRPPTPIPHQHWSEAKLGEDESIVWGPAFPHDHVHESSVVQGCGHGVHFKCFAQFLVNQQQQRIVTRFSADNFLSGEFLCPLCRALNNCFMPVLWSSNTLDAECFLKEPDEPMRDMERAIGGHHDQSQRLDILVQNALSTLNSRFFSAIRRHDFSDDFHSNVRSVLLRQMLWIQKTSPYSDSKNIYGLRMVYRSLAWSIAHAEIALRGQGHSTPFGGLLVDQLPSRTTQFLRIFAKYVNTLTGFIMTSFMQFGKEPEINEEVSISPEDTLTKLVEMMFFGIHVNGLSPITVVRQAIVAELNRVFANARNINVSDLAFDHADLDPEVAHALQLWVPGLDPKLVYVITKHHMTVVLRRYVLLVFSICGKYNPEDYCGMMEKPEHERLLISLKLPTLDTFIKNLAKVDTPEGLTHAHFQRSIMSGSFQIDSIEYPGIYRLISLPTRLDAMFNIKGRKIPIDPTVCLTCGFMCSIQSSEFGLGDSGHCNEHMARCGVTQGLFLLPRRNYILLLLPQGRGTFITAPYLDLHGEPDENMRRGRPHYLQPLRYNTLIRDIWLWNGLPNLIARRLDQNQDNGGWETL